MFCQLRAGKRDQAGLGLDLLGDQGAKDAAFSRLASALGGQKVTIDSLPDPTPLDLVMLRAANLPLPRDPAKSRNPGVLAALAQDRALIPPFASPPPSRPRRPAPSPSRNCRKPIWASPSRQAGSTMPLPPPPAIRALGRARLYQAAGGTLQPQARARLLQASLDRARHQGGYLLAAQVDMAYLLPLAPARNWPGLPAMPAARSMPRGISSRPMPGWRWPAAIRKRRRRSRPWPSMPVSPASARR